MNDSGDRFAKNSLSGDFVLLITDAQPRLFGFLLKRLGRRDQALEVLQNVNLTLCQKSSDFSAGTEFMAWAYTVAKMQILAFRKMQSREKLAFSSELLHALDALDEAMMKNDTWADKKEALVRCLKKSSENNLSLVMRRYAETLSSKAIAGELGRSENSVNIRLHRIREQLLACIKLDLAQESHG